LYELKKQKQVAEREKKDKQNELNEMMAKWQKAKLAGVSINKSDNLILIFVCYRKSNRKFTAMKRQRPRAWRSLTKTWI
jgi:hypothetical protein